MHVNIFRTQCSFLSKAAIQKENKPFPMKKKVSFKLPICNLLVSSSQKRREGSQLKVYAALEPGSQPMSDGSQQPLASPSRSDTLYWAAQEIAHKHTPTLRCPYTRTRME